MNNRKRPKLEIRETRKYGKGVFAAEDIEKGRIVWVLDGERMDALDLVERVNGDAENINDPLQIGKRTYIDLDEFSRTFNHSCDPSTGIRKTSEMFALRDIKKGEELTFDYSATIAPTEWKMRCKCGSRNCRGILGDVLSVPREQLDYYKRHGALQKYMKAILTDVEAGRYEIPKYELAALAKLKRTSEEFP
ncbi:MAG: SET domain-containing protein-lysine N-methyltransferase [Verrucomicrobia bacterium]|jgi:hypothetical protein|nr:SET domain-containing protein-lysine N-methyltransferase [Verrucomicrobiota bacterium]